MRSIRRGVAVAMAGHFGLARLRHTCGLEELILGDRAARAFRGRGPLENAGGLRAATAVAATQLLKGWAGAGRRWSPLTAAA